MMYYLVEDRTYRQAPGGDPLLLDRWNAADRKWVPYRGDVARVILEGFMTEDPALAAEASLSEFNHCHGSDGRFSSACGPNLVGMTSARPPGDAKARPNKVVAETMRAFEDRLRSLPGVSRAMVTPAVGQWDGGSEFSWAVSYNGNGQAKKLLARTAKTWDQDAVLFMTRANGAKYDAIFEMEFSHVPASVRTALAGPMSQALTGWTWFKRGGKTVLRAASVPAWGGSNHRLASARVRIARVFRNAGMPPLSVSTIKGYQSVVMQKAKNADGTGLTYDDVLRG